MSATRWVWIKEENGAYVLAFTYFDSQAGPSAKGAVVTQAAESWTKAVEHPDRTFRDPKAFGAIPISEDEARQRGLPAEPPWLSIFTEGVARVPAAPDGSRIEGRVLLDGAPASFGVEVRLGKRFGTDFLPVDKCTPAADGTFDFKKPAKGEHFLLAESKGLCSKYVRAEGGAPITLEVLRAGSLSGRLQRDGKPTRGQVRASSVDDSAPARLTRAEADGTYRLSGLLPGRYAIEVLGVDSGNMVNGTPTTDTIDVASGEVLERDYVILGGAAVRVTVQTNTPDNSDHANVYLIAGTLTPKVHGDVRPLFRTPAFRSANSSSRKAGIVSTQFLDVLPGPYTLCTFRDRRTGTKDDMALVVAHIEVGATDQDVRLELPPG